MEIENHIIKNIKFVNSPNFNERPENTKISLIVIHSISLPPNVYGNNYVEDFFMNKLIISDHDYFQEIQDMRVSSHLYIKRTGEIIQFVPFNKKAWHAGLSSYMNEENCNEFSIGIELEGYHTEKYTNHQYKSLLEVSKALINTYKDLNKDNIVGHSDISPGRKEDPGKYFEWNYYLERL
jgi:AmpD protein